MHNDSGDEKVDLSNYGFYGATGLERYRQQLKEQQEIINRGITTLKDCLQLASNAENLPQGFRLLQGADTRPKRYADFETSFASTNRALPLKAFIVLNEYTYRGGKGRELNGYDDYFAGLLTLKTSYPYTVIKPEKLEDKIQDLFTHAELDFADSKRFSDEFYVLTKDKGRLSQLMAHKSLDGLTDAKQLVVEIIDNRCLFLLANCMAINQENAQQFCEAAKLLNKILNE